MQVGPEYWRCVTTDSAGVPSGGKYGNVAWFEESAGRRGMKIAWSRRFDCFLLYTRQNNGRCVAQMLLRKHGKRGWGDPVAMTHELLVVMTQIREDDCRANGTTIMEEIGQRDRDRKAKVVKGWDTASVDIEDEVMRRVQLRMDPRSRNEMALPKRLGLYNAHKQRRRKRVNAPPRILVP